MVFGVINKKTAIIAIAMGVCLAQGIYAQDGKRIYAGVRLGGSMGMGSLKDEKIKKSYEENEDYTGYKFWDGGSLDVAPFISLQLADKFALQTEAMITKFGYEGAKYKYNYGYSDEEYGYGHKSDTEEKELLSRRALVIPILAKFTVRANDKISFGLFAGPHFTANIGKWEYYDYSKGKSSYWNTQWTEDGEKVVTKEYEIDEGAIYIQPSNDEMKNSIKVPLMSFTVGTNFGFMTNVGTFFVDVRFLSDISDIGNVKQNNGERDEDTGKIKEDKWEDYVHRAKLSFSLGYEFGAGSR